jgi:acylphosphatase
MICAKHYRVRGRVQGVGFRWFVQRAAERLGIVGDVRNLPNGEVEVRAQADESVLDLFKRELQNGPPSARVGEVMEQDLPVTDRYSSFQIG